MADQATERLTISAPLQKVFETIVDFEHYPEFFREIKETEVHEVDPEGRGSEVTFRTAAMGRSTRYRLRYDYTEAPERLTWELVDGDIMSQLDGYYQLEPSAADDSVTEVEYSLTIDLVMPLPGFVKRRGEGLILKAALPELKARVEGL
jgi:uncharacterized protein YndB with AHSA1/START domain